MAGPADVLANEMLTLLVDAGGTWDVGLSSTVPTLSSGAVAGVTDVTEVDHVTVDRDAADWDLTSPRVAGITVEFGAVSDDCSPVAWVLYDGATAVHFGRVVGLPSFVTTGTELVLPLQLVVPLI